MKNWSKGDRVSQPTYGAGTLVEVNEHHTVIDFDEGGRKVFATRLVVLQATNEPAPHKTPTRKRAVKKTKAEAYNTERRTPNGGVRGSSLLHSASGQSDLTPTPTITAPLATVRYSYRKACSGSTR